MEKRLHFDGTNDWKNEKKRINGKMETACEKNRKSGMSNRRIKIMSRRWNGEWNWRKRRERFGGIDGERVSDNDCVCWQQLLHNDTAAFVDFIYATENTSKCCNGHKKGEEEEEEDEAMRTARWFVYWWCYRSAFGGAWVSPTLYLAHSLALWTGFSLFNFINPHTAKHN